MDLAGYAAIAADRLAPKVLSEAPKAPSEAGNNPVWQERSCETCMYDPTTNDEPCTYCENGNQWTDG